jgi:hypothetical protein
MVRSRRKQLVTLVSKRVKEKGKAIPVTGRECPQGCETSRLPHFLDNQLTDGGEVFSAGRPLSPRNSLYSFLLEAASTPGS